MPRIKNISVFLLGLFVSSGVLVACAPTPNNVSLDVTPGLCVTSSYPGYESTITSYSNAYPLNATLPANSPYCMAVTLNNSNSGQNANNVQVYQGGLQLTYSVAGVSYSGYLIDFNASGIPQTTYTYSPVQKLGNMVLFDPNNCVTTIGANVNTLNKDGGKCTFYLELVGESLPVGNYPINLSVNYTNGNDNYFVQNNINQRVNMYIGGNFTTPSTNLALLNNLSSNIAESLPVSFTGGVVQQLITDSFGNVFVYDGNTVYIFNGNSWQVSTLPEGVSKINQLSSDNNGNVFAATNYGLWVYNLGSQNGWTSLNGNANSGNYSSVQSLSIAGTPTETIYATSQNNLLSCNWQPGSSCTFGNPIVGSGAYNSASLAVESSVLQYVGIGSQLWQISNNVLSPMSFATPYVLGNQSGNLLLDSQGLLYATFANDDPLIPAVFSNSSATLSAESALVSAQGNALNGKATGIALRSMNLGSSLTSHVVAFGDMNSLHSNDFTVSSSLVYLLLGYGSTANPIASTSWTPVTGLNGAVNGVTFASSLTAY